MLPPVQLPSRAGGGPESGGVVGAEPTVRGAAWAEPGVDGNHSQHPAGDHDPYGILCLQAHSASMTAEQQVLPRVWEQIHLCCIRVSGEVGIRTFLLGNALWSGQLVNGK